MERQIGALVEEMIQTSLLAQALRIKNLWEPRVRGLLANAADAAGHELRLMLNVQESAERYSEPMAGTQARAWGLILGIAQKQLGAAQAMLKEMTGRELTETMEAMTINGLSEPVPALDLPAMPDQGLAGRLAGAAPLKAAVMRSAAEFAQRVEALLQEDNGRSPEEQGIAERLERHVAWWRSRLALIANTTVHAVFNRGKRAVAEALRTEAAGPRRSRISTSRPSGPSWPRMAEGTLLPQRRRALPGA